MPDPQHTPAERPDPIWLARRVERYLNEGTLHAHLIPDLVAEVEALSRQVNTLKQPQACEKCNANRGVLVETVEGRGDGWKCHVCKWWNWLRAAPTHQL